jgi:hypothetical protein
VPSSAIHKLGFSPSPAAASARACKIFDKLVQLERSTSSGAIVEGEHASLLIKVIKLSKMLKIIKLIIKGPKFGKLSATKSVGYVQAICYQMDTNMLS